MVSIFLLLSYVCSLFSFNDYRFREEGRDDDSNQEFSIGRTLKEKADKKKKAQYSDRDAEGGSRQVCCIVAYWKLFMEQRLQENISREEAELFKNLATPAKLGCDYFLSLNLILISPGDKW